MSSSPFRFSSPSGGLDDSLLTLFPSSPEHEEHHFQSNEECTSSARPLPQPDPLWNQTTDSHRVRSPEPGELLEGSLLASRSPSPSGFDVSSLFHSRSKSLSPTLPCEFHASQPNTSAHAVNPLAGSSECCPPVEQPSASHDMMEEDLSCAATFKEEEGVVANELGLYCGPARPTASLGTGCGGVDSEGVSEQGNVRAGPNANGKRKRGMHVVDKPEMPQTARDGQHDWSLQKQPLEDKWDQRGVGTNAFFKAQIEKCKLSCKNQKLCLLFKLQLFVVDSVIVPMFDARLIDSVEESFFGWTGFRVKTGMDRWFRSEIESMWPGPNPPRETTLNNAFRRCGFVPTTTWEAAIRGHNDASFTYKKCKEYKKQKVGASS